MPQRTNWDLEIKLPELYPPTIPVTCVAIPPSENLQALYTQLPSLFAKDAIRRGSQTLQEAPAPATPVAQAPPLAFSTPPSISAPSLHTPSTSTHLASNLSGGGSNAPSPVNSVGFSTSMKRDRPDSVNGDAGSPSPAHKRRDTGEGKTPHSMMMPPPPPPSTGTLQTEQPLHPRTPTQQQHQAPSTAAESGNVGEALSMGNMGGAGAFPQHRPQSLSASSSGLGDLSSSGLFPSNQNTFAAPQSLPQNTMDPQTAARLQMRQQQLRHIQQQQQAGVPLSPQQQQLLAHFQNGSMQNQQQMHQQQMLLAARLQQQTNQQQQQPQEISLAPAGQPSLGGVGAMQQQHSQQQLTEQAQPSLGMGSMASNPVANTTVSNLLTGLDNNTLAQIQAIGPAALGALQMLQTQPGHPFIRYIHSQIPNFGQLPVIQQIQRFLVAQVRSLIHDKLVCN